MQFQPRTEKDILESRLFPKGDYDFEITEAAEKTSKAKGNDMIELKLRITDSRGLGRTLTDYLMPEVPLKFLHCCQVCGLVAEYENGSVSAADFTRKRGRLSLVIEKDKTKLYPDKNAVADYISAARKLKTA